MKKTILALFIFLAMASSRLWGQVPQMINYDAQNGLLNNQINDIIQDSLGYLWIGTEGSGINVFNGDRFVKEAAILPNRFVYSFQKVGNSIYGFSPNRVYQFKGGAYRHLIQSDTSHAIGMMREILPYKGTNYAINRGNKLFILRDKTISFYCELPISAAIIKIFTYKNYWKAITSNREEYILSAPEGDGRPLRILGVSHWLAAKEDLYFTGTMCYGQDTAVLTNKGAFVKKHNTFEPIYPSENNFVRFVHVDKHEGHWLGGFNGLFYKASESGEWQQVLNQPVISIYEDNQGTVWVGSRVNGLYKFYYQGPKKLNSEQKQGFFTLCKGPDNVLWAGSINDGVKAIKDGKVEDVHRFDKLENNIMRSVAKDRQHHYWFATLGGLVRYDGKTWSTVPQVNDSMNASEVVSIIPWKDGVLVGTPQGPMEIDSMDRVHPLAYPDSLNYTIWSMCPSKMDQSLYLGLEQGVYQWKDGHVKKLAITDAFGNSSITAIECINDSILAIGSVPNGVGLYNIHTKNLQRITEKDGLSGNLIYFIKKIAGAIWVGTNRGVDKLILNSRGEPDRIIPILINHETMQNAIISDSDFVYLGCIDGVYRVPLDYIPPVMNTPVYFEGAEDGVGEALTCREQVIPYRIACNALSLPYSQNSFSVQFNRVAGFELEPQFSYRLRPFEQDWASFSAVKEAAYRKVPPGHYTLEVRSRVGGVISPKVAKIQIDIARPFFLTWWFWAICITGAVILLFVMVRWRMHLRMQRTMLIAQVKEETEQNLRKEMAKDFHDEMGNLLARIINYSGVLQLNAAEEIRQEFLPKIEKSAKDLFQVTRDLIWSLESSHNTFQELFFHLKDFGQKLFESNTVFRTHFIGPSRGRSMQLPAKQLRDLSMVFKEAMTNAFRHSGADTVTFTMDEQTDELQIKLVDNGTCSAEPARRGRGLQNMENRAKRVGAFLKIEMTGNGTMIILTKSKDQ